MYPESLLATTGVRTGLRQDMKEIQMNRRKAIVWLSILSALCVAAVGASGASAATTVGECTTAAGTAKDFSDAHCDKGVTAGTGTFGHILFANGGTAIPVTATNANTAAETTASTPATLEGKISGIPIAVKCTIVEATGTVTNNAGGTVTFGNATTTFRGPLGPNGEFCEQEVPEKCAGHSVTVAKTTSAQTDPMNLKISSTTKTGPTGEVITFHEENAAGTEMGLKFAPTVAGGNFTEVTVDCPVATTAPVKGFTYATPGRVNGSLASTSGSGATVVFSKSSSIGGLLFAGLPATLTGALTFKRTSNGNALISTTKE
jgi:hypothetical protein